MPLAFVSSTPAKSTDTSLPFPPLPYSSDTPRWALPLASYSLKDALWTDWSLLTRLGNTCSKTVNKQAVCGAKKPTEPQPMVRVWKLGRSPSLCNLVNLCLQPRYKELRGRERVDFTFQGQETGEERPTRGNSRYWKPSGWHVTSPAMVTQLQGTRFFLPHDDVYWSFLESAFYLGTF